MPTRISSARRDAGWKRTDEGFIDARVFITRPKWSKTQIPAETLKAGKPPFQTGMNVNGI